MYTQMCAERNIKQNRTGKLLWRDTGGMHWRILAYSAGFTGELLSGILGGIHWRTAGELLWDTQWDTRRDPLVSRSGGILGEIHWRAALAGYWAGSTGEQLWWDTRRDTRRDPLVSCSGGILGGGVV